MVGKLLVSLTFLSASPGIPTSYKEACETSRRGLLEYAPIKYEIKEFETDALGLFKSTTGLTEEQLLYATYLYPALFQKISTRPLNLKIEYKGFSFRPEVEYRFSNDVGTSWVLFINKEF